jgi:hypothetical protein
VRLDDATGDRKPEPVPRTACRTSARWVAAHERLEGPLGEPLREAWSLVAYDDADRRTALSAARDERGSDHDGSVRRVAVGAGVDEEVVHDARE